MMHPLSPLDERKCIRGDSMVCYITSSYCNRIKEISSMCRLPRHMNTMTGELERPVY